MSNQPPSPELPDNNNTLIVFRPIFHAVQYLSNANCGLTILTTHHVIRSTLSIYSVLWLQSNSDNFEHTWPVIF